MRKDQLYFVLNILFKTKLKVSHPLSYVSSGGIQYL